MIDRENSFNQLGCAGRNAALLSLVLTVCFAAPASSEEAGWKNLWPFGKDQATDDAAAQQERLMLGDPALENALGEEEKEPWMVDSPVGKMGWPEIKMPKIEFPSPWRTEEGEEGWIAKPINKARAGAHNAMDRTRMAWNNSIDRMKIMLPGGDDGMAGADTQLAGEPKEPGFWSKLLGPRPADDSDDVVEMMAQEQLGTKR